MDTYEMDTYEKKIDFSLLMIKEAISKNKMTNNICCATRSKKILFECVVGIINMYIIYYFCVQLYKSNDRLDDASGVSSIYIKNNTLCIGHTSICIDTSSIHDEVLLEITIYTFRLLHILNFICIWSTFVQLLTKQFACNCRNK